MSIPRPAFNGIDHVHVYVTDRADAADWYGRVLGFTVVDSLAFWADDPGGPLTLEDSSGKVHLALFQRDPLSPASTIAFGASGEEFLQWKSHLEARQLLQRCSDHTVSWSLYFGDPDGNMHEITTYDHALVAQALSGTGD